MRRAIGVDTVVTFGPAVPGRDDRRVVAEDATFVAPDGRAAARRTGCPADAVTDGGPVAGPIRTGEASVDLATALDRRSRPADVSADATRRRSSRRSTLRATAGCGSTAPGGPAGERPSMARDVRRPRALAGQLMPGDGGHATRSTWTSCRGTPLAGLLLGVVAIVLGVAWVAPGAGGPDRDAEPAVSPSARRRS